MSRRAWYELPRSKRVSILLACARGATETSSVEMILDLLFDMKHESDQGRGIILAGVWTEFLREMKRLSDMKVRRT